MWKPNPVRVITEYTFDNHIFDEMLDQFLSEIQESSQAQLKLEGININAWVEIEKVRIDKETRLHELRNKVIMVENLIYLGIVVGACGEWEWVLVRILRVLLHD